MSKRASIADTSASPGRGKSFPLRFEWERELKGRLDNPSYAQSGKGAIDLFSGCGGLSMGFAAAGFEIHGAFDSWLQAIQTYRLNLGHRAEVLDLHDFEVSVERLSAFRSPGGYPAIIGGPPCQDFSAAGKRESKGNAELTTRFADLVSVFEPPFFVMENVPNAGRYSVYQQAIEAMESGGYHITKRILDASILGLPQKRKRLFAIGTRDIGLSLRIGELLDEVRKRGEDDVRLFGPITLAQWFGTDELPDFYYRHPRSYARRGIFSIYEPSPTIRGVNRPMPPTYKFIDKDREVLGFREELLGDKEIGPLTTQIRKQIQTFPSSFAFAGAKTASEQMIGNAVPVKMAYVVAQQISTALGGG